MPDAFTAVLDQTRKEHVAAMQRNSVRRNKLKATNIGASLSADKKNHSSTASDSVSGIRLLQRYLPPEQVDDFFTGCERLTIAQFYKECHPPSFSPPRYANWVVLGIVAGKSEFRQASSGSKYLMMKLSDLKYDVSLAVHGKSFASYYKIQPGTLIGILNPRLYTTKQDVMSVNLSIFQDGCVVEIGQAKDLGQCESMTKGTGRRCRNWIDCRRTQVCEYHMEEHLRSAASQRPEFNSVVSKFGAPVDAKTQKPMSWTRGGSVRWKQGLHIDHGVPTAKVSTSRARGNFLAGGTDRPISAPEKEKKRARRMAEDLKSELRLRKKLAARPDGVMLRNFDEKGHLVDTPNESSERDSNSHSAFGPEEIRRIGFNPNGVQVDLQLAKQSQPQRTSTVPLDDDDSDDLEII